MEVPQSVFQDGIQAGDGENPAAGADAGIGEQIGDEPLHAGGALGRAVDVFEGLGVHVFGEAAFQQFHVTAHRAQRLLEVVRGNVGELFQVAIGPLGFLGAQLEGGMRPLPLYRRHDQIGHRFHKRQFVLREGLARAGAEGKGSEKLSADP